MKRLFQFLRRKRRDDKPPTPTRPLTEAEELDIRAEVLIARLHATVAPLQMLETELTRSQQQERQFVTRPTPVNSVPKLARSTYQAAEKQLRRASERYRGGSKPTWCLDNADACLNLLYGLLGDESVSDCSLGEIGLRLLAANVRLQDEDRDSKKLAFELFENACGNVDDAIEKKTGASSLWENYVEDAQVGLNRMEEALTPDSAGVRFVERLAALQANLRVVREAA